MSNVSSIEDAKITLTIRETGNVYAAINQIQKVYDPKASYTLGYVANKCEAAMRKFQKQRLEIQKPFVIMIEQTGPDGKKHQSPMVPPDKMEALNELLETAADSTITIARAPVKLSAIVGPESPTREVPKPGALAQLINVIVDDTK